jgi:hypothetical protein
MLVPPRNGRRGWSGLGGKVSKNAAASPFSATRSPTATRWHTAQVTSERYYAREAVYPQMARSHGGAAATFRETGFKRRLYSGQLSDDYIKQ